MKRGGKNIESLDSLRVLSLFSGCGGHGFRIRGGFLYVIVSLYLLKVRGFKRLSMNTGFVYRGIVFGRSLRMIY